MKKLILTALIAASMVGIAHAAPVTDCSNQNSGVSCVTPSGGTGTCQPAYDASLQTSTTIETCQTPPTAGSPAGRYCDVAQACPAGQICDMPQGGPFRCVAATTAPPSAPLPATINVSPGFTALAPIPGLTDTGATSVINSTTLSNFFNNLYKYLIGVAAILAVIMITWSGIEIAVNKDNVSKLLDSKGKIYNAIFGLVLVLSPALVFSIINPSILNLSLNLPPIKTAQYSGALPTGGQVATTVDAATGCSVSGTAGILQIATCSSPQAATTWGQQNCTDGNLSTIANTQNANGVVLSFAICAGKQPYIFIDPTSWDTFVINTIRPVVSTTHAPPDRVTNGADAMAFTNICKSAGLGLETCVSNDPFEAFATPCNLPPGPDSNTAWKCYTETLSCEDSSIDALSRKCSKSPNWVPFQ